MVLFSEDGAIVDVIALGPPGGDQVFYYRLSEPRYHTVVVRSDVLVMHETTCGPFSPGDAEEPGWSPAPADADAAGRYMSRLASDIDGFPAAE